RRRSRAQPVDTDASPTRPTRPPPAPAGRRNSSAPAGAGFIPHRFHRLRCASPVATFRRPAGAVNALHALLASDGPRSWPRRDKAVGSAGNETVAGEPPGGPVAAAVPGDGGNVGAELLG